MSDTTTDTGDLQARVRAVIAETFELAPEALPEAPDADSVEKWDSLGHMQLVEALEQAFGLEIEHADAVLLLSQGEIVGYLKGRLGS